VIQPAPPEFWQRVIERFAEMLLEREAPKGFREAAPPSAPPRPAGVILPKDNAA
jgi:hypothetical protein